MRHREPAICLRTTDYSETSQVAHFLTRDQGVVRLIAKGTKRPRSKSGGALDLLAEGDLVYTDSRSGGLGTLIEFSEQVSRLAIRGQSSRLHAALYMLELVGQMLAEGDPHPGTFDLLHNALSRLAEADSLPAAVLAYFQYRLLRQVGLLGDLLTCTSCGRRVEQVRRGAAGQAYFSSREGGLVCSDCTAPPTEKYALDADTLTGLGVLQAPRRTTGGRATFPESQARAVNRLLAYHVAEQLGKPLRTSRYAID